MAIATRIMSSGLPAMAANNIVGDSAIGLTATGSSITDAYLLTAAVNDFTTVAASTGAKLMPLNPGDSVVIFNGGAQTLTIYPNGSDVFNNAASTVTLATMKTMTLTKTNATRIATVTTA